MSHICPDCLQPLRTHEQGTNVQRINGELVFTSTFVQVTCFSPDCQREGITLEVNAFFALTDAQIKRYNRKATV